MFIDGDGGAGDSGRTTRVDRGTADAGSVDRGSAETGFVKQDELFGARSQQGEGERLYGGRYKTVEELEGHYEKLRKFAGESGNGKFTRETLEAVMRDQGWYNPAVAPEKYDWTEFRSEGSDDAAGFERVEKHFRETKQTQEQAAANLKFFQQEGKSLLELDRAATAQKLKDAGIIWDRGAVEKGLQERWGETWEAEGEATLAYMNRNQHLAQLIPFLAHRDFGWDVMRAIRLKAAGEQPLRAGSPGPDRTLSIQDRIAEITESEAFNKRSHHRHKEAKAEWQDLCRQLARIKHGRDQSMG